MVIVGEEALSSSPPQTEASFYWKPLRKREGEEARTFYRLPRGSGWRGEGEGGEGLGLGGYKCQLSVKRLLMINYKTY